MALNKAADAEHRLLVPGRVHRSPPAQVFRGDCGWAGRAGNRYRGARGYADLTTIFGSCLGSGGSNSESSGLSRGREALR
jgi:hypothetical protein